MEIKKIVIFALILISASIIVSASITPPDNFNFRNKYNITNADYLYANYLMGDWNGSVNYNITSQLIAIFLNQTDQRYNDTIALDNSTIIRNHNFSNWANASGFIVNWSALIGTGGNLSWNQSLADSLYVPYIGASKDVNLGNNNILLNKTILFGEGSGRKKILGMNNTGGIDGDGFWLEYWYSWTAPFGDWMIFRKTDGNDYTPDGGIAFVLSNASNYNRTIVKFDGYGIANFTDYNLHTQGNITSNNLIFKDNTGQTRWLNNMATHTAQLESNTNLDASRSTLNVVGGVLNYTFIPTYGCAQFNFNGTIYPTDHSCIDNTSIEMLCGTDTIPKINYVYWELTGTVPTLKTAESYPLGSHIDVGTFVIGACAGTSYTSYSYNRNRYELDSFVQRSLSRWEETGTLFLEGFTPNANATNLTVASGGKFFTNLVKFTGANNLSVSEGFFFINSSGEYVNGNKLKNFTSYIDGTAFSGANERVNIVWGVIATNTTAAGTVPSAMRLVAVLPNYPGAANVYTSLTSAVADIFDETNFFPSGELKKTFTPIARTILRTNTKVFETFPDGKYYQDIRGKVTIGGSAASPSITDHAMLNNLDYASAGHTGFASSAQLLTIYNVLSGNVSIINTDLTNNITEANTHIDNNITLTVTHLIGNMTLVNSDILNNITETNTHITNNATLIHTHLDNNVTLITTHLDNNVTLIETHISSNATNVSGTYVPYAGATKNVNIDRFNVTVNESRFCLNGITCSRYVYFNGSHTLIV